MKFTLGTCSRLLLLATLCACSQQQEATSTEPVGTAAAPAESNAPSATVPATTVSLAIPASYTKLEEAKGDLDNDGQEELVVVYDTPTQTDMGTERKLYIYKQDQQQGWQLWHQSIGPVMPSEHGGVLGDPFQGIEIQRGALVVYHFGGSSSKWSYTHRYRHRNGQWHLIGATVTSGAPCEGFDTYDYNLATGKVAVSIEKENCDEDEDKPVVTHKEAFTFTAKPDTPVNMDGFYPGENEVKIPAKPDESFHY